MSGGAAATLPISRVYSLGDSAEMHQRALTRVLGYNQIHTRDACSWISLELRTPIPVLYVLEHVRIYRQDNHGLWMASIRAITGNHLDCWKLSPWKQVEQTDTIYQPGITLRFGFHHKLLPQLS